MLSAVVWCRKARRRLQEKSVPKSNAAKRDARTLQTDRPQNLHDAICPFFPFPALPFNHTTHARRTGTDDIVALVDEVCLRTHHHNGNTGGVVSKCTRA